MLKTDKKVFVCLHPSLNNAQLTKDPGMFAYIMHRELHYDGYVVCYDNGPYPDLTTETNGLKLIFLKKGLLYPILKSIPDRLLFILKNAGKIDVLQVFQFSIASLLSGALYKILNPNGIVYIKLDWDFEGINRHAADIRDFARFSKFIDYDIVSVESIPAAEYLKNHPLLTKYADKIYYIPNGVDVEPYSNYLIPWESKENYIMHNGRLGSYQKATEIALEAFSRICKKHPDWKLLLIGPSEPGFDGVFKKYKDNPQIEYLGFLGKRKMRQYLSKSKILLFPSRYEAFGFAQVEAAFLGNVIVGSDLTCMRQITDNGNYGALEKVDDIDGFARSLDKIMDDQKLLHIKSEEIKKFVAENFSWTIICINLELLILQIKMGRLK